MSDSGVPLEPIADLVGRAGTAVTRKVYRHQLRPVVQLARVEARIAESAQPGEDAFPSRPVARPGNRERTFGREEVGDVFVHLPIEIEAIGGDEILDHARRKHEVGSG